MAERPTADPFSTLIEPSCNSILFHPDLVPDDHRVLQGGFQSELPLELDFDLDDINWDLSVDDLLISECQGELSPPFPPSCDGSPTQNSGVSSSSPVAGHASGNMSVRSPESGHSANYSADSVGRLGGQEEEREGEEEKRSARLMRNRESAQLSRQRKKHYVEELEEKVRSMHSTIIKLNSKISFFMTENASLKQKLGGNGSNGPQSGVCVPAAVPPIHFPWIPFPGIAFRPHGSPVPLVPIPKLKLQQPENGGKVMKSEGRKGGRKTKKVASISLLGFLFVMLTCRVLVPGLEHIFEGNNELVGLGQGRNMYFGDSNGRVLSVSGISGSLNYTNEVRFNDAKALGEEDLNRMTNRSSHGKMESEEKPLPFDDHSYSQNSSETLPALLYVSRNGKHVKINGNLIINSVLASEKAVSQAKSRNHGVKSASKEDKDTTFEVPGNLAYALALSRSGNGVNKHSESHGSSAEQQRARSSDSEDLSKEKTQDGPLQQWFLEGLAGPIFSSGACTEVFRFEISPSSVEQSGIIPSSPSTNSTKTSGINATGTLHGSSSRPEKKKNRRFLYPRAIPLAGTTLNNSEHLGKEHNHSNSAAPLVVSILADPREVSDSDVEEIMSAKKSISRIFVVVLLDSVKYVTYSCVLPFMSPSPHLVN
ncbi:bZIP transcription factor 39-like [Phalaenopsis equestris]|uniref:bZIP transcription factor 39-like n=1 Tax=Phalaenopsis equestris TaxID=78828 RepID=UPI0009E26EA1|nr:bZIP transcription factor 39-like [Phalaenopsis equestris]